MHRTSTARRVGVRGLLTGSLLAASLWGGRTLLPSASAEVAPVAEAVPTAVEVDVLPARPTIDAERAWSMIEQDLSGSPWLRNADEFAAWADTTGNRCQVVTSAMADKLRELDYLLNEHWIGRRATQVLLAAAGTAAAVVPEPGVVAGAGTLVVVLKTSPEWTEALAQRAEAVGAWIEESTEVWEAYATAYKHASTSPSAEHIAAWMDAAEALLPYLERGQELVTTLNRHLETIDGHLTGLRDYLDGVDHWTVRWLADETNEHAIDPALATLNDLRPKLQMTQGRLMIDRALIATMPLRFMHVEVVDAPVSAE